jgi:hypothetical protein
LGQPIGGLTLHWHTRTVSRGLGQGQSIEVVGRAQHLGECSVGSYDHERLTPAAVHDEQSERKIVEQFVRDDHADNGFCGH